MPRALAVTSNPQVRAGAPRLLPPPCGLSFERHGSVQVMPLLFTAVAVTVAVSDPSAPKHSWSASRRRPERKSVSWWLPTTRS
jgi:hypothetical protein